MIINKFLRFVFFAVIPGLFCLLEMLSCKPVEENNLQKGQVREMVGGLPGGKAFEIDSVKSEIQWTLRKSDGSFLKGSFKPAKGYLLLEGNSLSAGFLEGDFWANNLLKDSLNAPTLGGLKWLKDSLPVFFTPNGRKIRFDLKQTSRVIPRSEFRSQGIRDSLSPTHDLQFQAEIADSSNSVRLPLRVTPKAAEVTVQGSCRLNLREFGILSAQVSDPQKKQWIPEADLEFRLLFRKSSAE